MYLSYLVPVSYIFTSWVFSGPTFSGGCHHWWPWHPLFTDTAGNIPFLKIGKWLRSFSLESRYPKHIHRLFFFFFPWLHCTPLGIIAPWPRIESGPLAVKAQNPNYWTAREFPTFTYFWHFLIKMCSNSVYFHYNYILCFNPLDQKLANFSLKD